MSTVNNVNLRSNPAEPSAAEGDRVLIVGDDPAYAAAIERTLHRAWPEAAVTLVEDHLQALGEIGRHGPPAAAIVRIDALLDDELPQAARAMRSLAPHMVLLATGDPGDSIRASKAMQAGFDHWLAEPLDAGQLANWLPPDSAAPPGPALSNDAPPAVTSNGVGPGDASSSTVSLEAATPTEAAEDLGDVDLVEQLLTDRQGLDALALELISQRSGLPHIALARDVAAVPEGHLAAPVTFQNRQFGLLHAPPPAGGTDLTAWAQWLGRWLALGQRYDELWHLALRDELTGAWNRRYFMRFLAAILDRAAHERFRVTLMVFDIDDFKQYNDRYGHPAGDEILRETARLMSSVVRTHDVVARIGGDEFAVIFWEAHGPRRPNSQHPHDVRKAAERFQKAICTHRFPKLFDDAPGTLTISGGLAGFPWDGRTPQELLEHADAMALHSKQQGKNALTFGQGASRGGLDLG